MDSAPPDGLTAYTCAWNPGTEWDVQAGEDIAVRYAEPDGDGVINVFNEIAPGAPDLVVGKTSWGQPTGGGAYVYNMTYENIGGAIGTNVVVSDILPTGMSYITDTSGLTATFSGNVVSWNLGSLSPGENGFFDIFVNVSPAVAAGTVLTNTAVITANEVDANPFDNSVDWGVTAQPNDSHVYVTKGSLTPDPAPGYDFIYTVDACNYGSTGSAAVIVTDTLPAEVTFSNWWSNISGWTALASSSNQLVVTRPTIDAGTCWTVFVQVSLSPVISPGTPITNTAFITSVNDIDGNDNQFIYSLNVGAPHINLDVKKDWNWGSLVPGGAASYNISVANSGNIPIAAPVWVTDTLPAGTVFRDAFLDTDTGPIQFSPVSSGTGFVVWDIGAMDAGAYASLEVVLDINGATQTGTVLTNTAEVMAVPGEDNLADNVSVWVEKLNPPGPNLRVRKTGDWNDNGTNTRSAWYEVVVENVGGLPVNNVVVTDTYPASMVLLGGVNSDWSSFWSWTNNPATNELVVTFDKLNPGKVARIYFNAEVPGSGPLANGLTFNNLVRVKRPLGDPTPLDNVDHFTLTTGPDLAVQKEWLSGIPIPGNLITFSIHWGNREGRQEWWWGTQGDVWITETLPSELEFVSAVWPSCGNCPIGPDVIKGNEYGFRLGPIPGGGADEILITTLVS
ncbi:MAG: hypothetical protein ACE5FD_14830, partial [Anaerolineae bacterium]